MKKIAFIGIIFCLALFCTTANAAVVNTPEIDIDNKTITVSGELGEAVNERFVTVYAVKGSNKTLSAESDVVYINIIEVEEDGIYSDSFPYSDSSVEYTIVVDAGKNIRADFTYKMCTWDEINTFIDAVGKDEISDKDLIDNLKTMGAFIKVDTSLIKTEKEEAILLRRIDEGRTEIKENGKDALSQIVTEANCEINILNVIKTAKSWYEVDAILKDNAEFTSIDKFIKTVNTGKWSEICTELAGKDLKNISSLCETIADLVEKADTPSGNGGSGGGGGETSRLPLTAPVQGTETPDEERKEKNVFYDLEDYQWAADSIYELYKKGVVSGVGNGLFEPDRSVKREEIAKMIAIAFDYNTKTADCNFKDVDKASWSYQYISSLFNAEILRGMEDNVFGLGRNVTRQDLSVMLYRIAVDKEFKFEKNDVVFSDSDLISDYAELAVNTLASHGIISGYTDGSFAPHQTATRAQAAKLIYELILLLETEA